MSGIKTARCLLWGEKTMEFPCVRVEGGRITVVRSREDVESPDNMSAVHSFPDGLLVRHI
jgi:hypothetical protein